MKYIDKSKIFVLSFLTLVFGSCAVPFLQFLINFINEIYFIVNFYFFYQLQVNLQKLLFEKLLPFLIFIWVFLELVIYPTIIKLQFSRTLRIFLATKILKKEIDFFTFNKKECFNKRQKFKNGENKDTNPQELTKVTEIQKITNAWGSNLDNLNFFQNCSYHLRHFFNILKSMFLSFPTAFHKLFLNKTDFRRGNF